MKDRELTTLQVTFLGTSSGVPTRARNVSAVALRLPQRSEMWLFDCGEGNPASVFTERTSALAAQTGLRDPYARRSRLRPARPSGQPWPGWQQQRRRRPLWAGSTRELSQRCAAHQLHPNRLPTQSAPRPRLRGERNPWCTKTTI